MLVSDYFGTIEIRLEGLPKVHGCAKPSPMSSANWADISHHCLVDMRSSQNGQGSRLIRASIHCHDEFFTNRVLVNAYLSEMDR